MNNSRKGMGKGKKGRDDQEPEHGGESDVDALFQLPHGQFTTARNSLAARLKKAGRDDRAAKVKALAKPSLSAWVVNQLYWKHRETFNDLIAAGRRLVQAQLSQFAGRAADMSGAQAEHREALSTLARMAETLLRDAGYNATPDTMRRISATLEALSTRSSGPETPPPGRLTEDLSPPGFESLAALLPPGGPARPPGPARVVPFSRPGGVPTRQPVKDDAAIAPAKAALHAAELALREARRMAEDLSAARDKAAAYVSEAEKKRLDAEEAYRNAGLQEREARKHLDSVSADAEKAQKTLADAVRAVEEARSRLKS